MAISVQESEIGSLFVGYFNRSADPAGLAYWVGQLNSGTPLTSIAQSFSVQPEAIALYPFLTNPTLRNAGDFVVSIYQNLFNREVDDAGLAWWVFELGLGRLVGPMILNIISGALKADLQTINNKSTVAAEYAQAFEAAHRTWTPADLASSRSVLSGVTFDPATVTAAEAKIHDIVNPTLTLALTPTAEPAIPTMNLTVAGDLVALNGTTGTLTSFGTDLASDPSDTYGTVASIAAAGFQAVHTTATATLSAAGNSAATTFNFETGVIGGPDAVNGHLKYTGFTDYVASAHGDTVTMTASGQSATGGASSDTYKVTGGTVTIHEVGGGGSPHDDVVVVSAGATAHVSTLFDWIPTAATSNDGTASIESNGANVILTNVTGTEGWTLTNTSALGNIMVGSPNDDVLIGNAAANTLQGNGGNDTMTGDDGVDTFRVGAGTDTITDLGAGGADIVQVQAGGATAKATLVADWTASAATFNSGTANVDAAGFNVNLAAVAVGTGWTLTNSTATGITMIGSALDDTITGGAGADIIAGSAGADVMSGGAGANRFDFSAGAVGTTPTTTNFDTITDWAAGVGNRIHFQGALTADNGGGTGLRTNAGGLTTDPANLAAFIAGLSTSNTATTGSAIIYSTGGDSYLFISDGTAGLQATDDLIKLTGLTTATGFTIAGGDITAIA